MKGSIIEGTNSVWLLFILSAVSFLFLFPSLINSITLQSESSLKTYQLSAEISDIENHRLQMAYFPPEKVQQSTTVMLKEMKATYKSEKFKEIIGNIIIAIKAFFTWLSIVIFTRIFNDHFYLRLMSLINVIGNGSTNHQIINFQV